jgi:hypothetical protein
VARPTLLPLPDVVAYLDAGQGEITPRYVMDLIHNREVHGVKVANKWRVTEESLLAYVERGGTQRSPKPAATTTFEVVRRGRRSA